MAPTVPVRTAFTLEKRARAPATLQTYPSDWYWNCITNTSCITHSTLDHVNYTLFPHEFVVAVSLLWLCYKRESRASATTLTAPTRRLHQSTSFIVTIDDHKFLQRTTITQPTPPFSHELARCPHLFCIPNWPHISLNYAARTLRMSGKTTRSLLVSPTAFCRHGVAWLLIAHDGRFSTGCLRSGVDGE